MDMATFRRARLETCGGLRGTGLEIGAYFRPTVTDPAIEMKYLDFYSTEELREQAVKSGDNPEEIVHVDYVVAGEDYRNVVDRTFDFIIANHVFEHIVCSIAWLQMMSDLLKPGGHLLLTLPDKKYSFDRYRDDTSIAHLIWDYFSDATFEQKAQVHAYETSIYYDRLYIKQTITPAILFNTERIKREKHHPGVHCHVFQGETFLRRIMKPLLFSKLIDYTLADFNEKSPWGEFNVVLRKGWTSFEYDLSDFYESSSAVAPPWAYQSIGASH